jgi:hypothetical protein
MANTSGLIPEDRFRKWWSTSFTAPNSQLKKVHPGKVADLSNCLTYLRTLLLTITTGNTKIQQE